MSDTGVWGPYGPGDGSPGHSSEALSARVSTSPEQPRMRMRQRLVRFGAPKNQQSAVLDPLFRVIRHNHPKADLAVIERAYRTAEHYHEGQLRKSGDPYITHPLAVTTILAELGMTEATLCAALLHDTVEDTSYTIEQLTADFGEEVASLVNGVTKLDKVAYGESAKAETIRKMVIAMSRDIRVLVIKVADRLHNMRTIGFLRPDKQHRISKETLEIFAPLAHRLGMNTVKWELEDLSFAAMEPAMYKEIVRLVAAEAPRRERYLREVIEKAKAELAAAGIKATVYGRPKHYYSIYQKMVVRGRDFKDIYDLIGVRILVKERNDCYAAMGLLHVVWKPLPGRFKDYIANPKLNLYQSLHTTVLGPEGKAVELQIRTEEMHRMAEYGVAAHWKYKAKLGNRQLDDQSLAWVHQLNQWQKETADPGEFLESLRFEIQGEEVFVFTPKGDVIALPSDSTPVDFAYAVHTDVGHRCIGARVDGRLIQLDTKLSNGDVVEVLTSKSDNAGPSRDWLTFVASTRARNKIRQYFSRERKEESIDQGRDEIARQVRKQNLPLQRLLTAEHLAAVATELRYSDVNALYAAVGEHHVSAQSVVSRIIALEGGDEQAADESYEDTSVIASGPSSDSGIRVDDDPGIAVKLAQCCMPLPGDDIIGFVTRSSGVSVHRRDCTNADNLMAMPERIRPVSWTGESKQYFLVTLHISALDRAGLLSDVTKLLAEMHISILSANMTTGQDHTAYFRMTFQAPDPTQLQHIMASLRQVPGVFNVSRKPRVSP